MTCARTHTHTLRTEKQHTYYNGGGRIKSCFKNGHESNVYDEKQRHGEKKILAPKVPLPVYLYIHM